jgi:hypothetical protein
MFSLLASYFTSTKFIHSYAFNEHIINNFHIVLGITNNDKVGIAFEKFYENKESNNIISKIHLLNYNIRDKCNNNEVIYYFGEDNNQIRLKFYVKNNVESSMKDFYYHLFSVEENIDVHIKLKEEYIDFFTNSRFREMNKHFKNSDLIYFINLISQDRKLLYNKIPFISIEEKEEKEYIGKKEEVNLLSF